MIAAAECGRVRLLVRGRAHGRKARRRGAATTTKKAAADGPFSNARVALEAASRSERRRGAVLRAVLRRRPSLRGRGAPPRRSAAERRLCVELGVAEARRLELCPGSLVHRAADAAAGLQPGVRGVLNRVNLEVRDVALPHPHDAVNRGARCKDRSARRDVRVRRSGIRHIRQVATKPLRCFVPAGERARTRECA